MDIRAAVSDVFVSGIVTEYYSEDFGYWRNGCAGD
jgi:hypothetical protein